MLLRTKLHGKTYEFPDIRLLMGKANEEKSGDHLAGVGAETAAERVAAKLVLAEVPLWVLRDNPAVPYDQDEVTRVIQDAVDPTIYNEIKDWTVGEFREWILADTTSTDMIRRVSNGLTSEMVSAVTKLMSNLDLMYGAKKFRFRRTAITRSAHLEHYHRAINPIIPLIRQRVSGRKFTRACLMVLVIRSLASIRSMIRMALSRVCSI